MRKNRIIDFIITSITLLFAISLVVLTVESTSKNMVMTITVEPNRVIIVDKNFTIQKIMSNTKLDVRPIVYLENEDGMELPYSEAIIRQYYFLKPTLNFNEPGIVYDREDRAPVALIKLVVRTVKKFIGMPF